MPTRAGAALATGPPSTAAAAAALGLAASAASVAASTTVAVAAAAAAAAAAAVLGTVATRGEVTERAFEAFVVTVPLHFAAFAAFAAGGWERDALDTGVFRAPDGAKHRPDVGGEVRLGGAVDDATRLARLALALPCWP